MIAPGSSDPVLNTPIIYGPAGVCTLADRGWILFKRNAKTCFLILLVPLTLSTLVSVLASIPSAFPTMTKFLPQQLLISLAALVLALVLGIGSWFVTFFACCTLARILYFAILREQTIGIRESMRAFKDVWPVMFIYFIGFLLLWIGFILIDTLIFGVGFFATMMLLIVMMSNQQNTFVQGGAVIISILIGFVVFALMFVVVSFQSLMFAFPLIAFSASDEDYVPIPWKSFSLDAWLNYWSTNISKTFHTVSASLRTLFANLLRSCRFGALLLLLYMAMVLLLHVPVFIWMAVEYERLTSLRETMPGVVPLHITLVFQVWSSLVASVVWSYMFAAVTLFLYDCKIRTEGLDFRLMLDRLKSRKKDVIRF